MLTKAAGSRVTTKGAVVIPIESRRRHGIVPGARVTFVDRGDELVIRLPMKDPIRELMGVLKTGGSMTRALLAERRRDREREDQKWKPSSTRTR